MIVKKSIIETSEMEGSTKGKTYVSSSQMDPSKTPFIPTSPYIYDDANENIKVENDVVSGAAIDNNSTSKPNESNASNTIMDINSDHDMDTRKLRRVMSNRISAQKSRMKKLQYLADLEYQVRAVQDQIANLNSQVKSYENQKLRIQLENEKIGCEIETHKKITSLRAAEIVKNKFEVNVLREVHTKQHEQMKALMLNDSFTSFEPILNDQVSNYYYPGNGEETFDLPPPQSQIRITDVQNEHEANINLANHIGSMEISIQNAMNPNIKHHFARSDV